MERDNEKELGNRESEGGGLPEVGVKRGRERERGNNKRDREIE